MTRDAWTPEISRAYDAWKTTPPDEAPVNYCASCEDAEVPDFGALCPACDGRCPCCGGPSDTSATCADCLAEVGDDDPGAFECDHDDPSYGGDDIGEGV